MVSFFSEKVGDGDAVLWDEWATEAIENAAFEPSAPVVASGENAIASWSADRTGGVSVSKTHAFLSKAIAVWGGGLSSHVADIPVALVVGQDEDDVWLFSLGKSTRSSKSDGRERDQCFD